MSDALDHKTKAQVTNFLAEHAAPEGPIAATRTLVVAVAAVILLVITAIVILQLLVNTERDKLTTNLETRLDIVALGRADLMRTWLDGKLGMGLRLTQSPVMQLFATEIDRDQGGSGLPADLLSQLPHMQNALDDFTRQNAIAGAYMIARDGQAFLSSSAAATLSSAQRRAAQQVFKSGTTVLLPLRRTDTDLFVGVVQPVYAVQAQPGQLKPEVAGALLLSLSGSAVVRQILEPGPLAKAGETIWLTQIRTKDEGNSDTVVDVIGAASVTSAPRSSKSIKPADVGADMGFATRISVAGPDTVFSVARHVDGTPWTILTEYDRKSALQPLLTYRLVGGGIALLLVLCTTVAFAAIWLREKGESNKALADQYKDLASRINAHRELLDGINRSVPEMIGVKDLSGRYTFVNPPFAETFGVHGEASILGREDRALFPAEAAATISTLAKDTLANGEPQQAELDLTVNNEDRRYSAITAPFTNTDGARVGVVSVIRDITELYAMRAAQQRLTEQTVTALVTTIERSDPHLEGHSARIARVAVGIGAELGINDDDCNALKQAAMLSQIGKFFIPREILTKRSRLTDDEIKVMKRHILYTLKTVQDLELPQQVYDALNHMYERLDGSGYPNGLSNGEISGLGQLLGVADVFSARTSARGYRQTISAGEAIQILADNADKYEPVVVEALRTYVAAHPTEATDQRDAID